MVSSGHRFFGNVSNCWLNSYGKFGGATRRRFFAICEKKPGGGGDIRPPAVRGKIFTFKPPTFFFVSHFLLHIGTGLGMPLQSHKKTYDMASSEVNDFR